MSIEAYLTKRAEFEAIDKRLSEIATHICEVGRYLRDNRSTFSFSNTGIGLPAEVVLVNNPSSNADNWKSARQIMEVIADWHKAKNELQSAWFSVPENLRSGLQPPPQIALPRSTGFRF